MIRVTDDARRHITASLRDQHPDIAVRLTVDSGGCNGFSYRFDLTEGKPDDVVVSWGDGCLVVDPISAELIDEASVDYHDDLIGARLVVVIPAATSQCGCGTSFSL